MLLCKMDTTLRKGEETDHEAWRRDMEEENVNEAAYRKAWNETSWLAQDRVSRRRFVGAFSNMVQWGRRGLSE